LFDVLVDAFRAYIRIANASARKYRSLYVVRSLYVGPLVWDFFVILSDLIKTYTFGSFGWVISTHVAQFRRAACFLPPIHEARATACGSALCVCAWRTKQNPFRGGSVSTRLAAPTTAVHGGQNPFRGASPVQRRRNPLPALPCAHRPQPTGAPSFYIRRLVVSGYDTPHILIL
jgi:hypothetical protein